MRIFDNIPGLFSARHTHSIIFKKKILNYFHFLGQGSFFDLPRSRRTSPLSGRTFDGVAPPVEKHLSCTQAASGPGQKQNLKYKKISKFSVYRRHTTVSLSGQKMRRLSAYLMSIQTHVFCCIHKVFTAHVKERGYSGNLYSNRFKL
jgi:hypothetical protein